MGGGSRRRAAGQLEREILSALWSADGPLTPAQIQASLDAGLAYNTVHTILTRLVEKGRLVRVTSEGRTLYAPTQDAADSAAEQMASVLDAAADRGAILARFVSSLTPEDEAALRSALDGRPPR
jgi:predicted transcriptional regulator